MSTPLVRPHFTISRASEYFTLDELVKQTGHPPSRLLLWLINELLANSADVCEREDVAPVLGLDLTVTDDAITVAVHDIGPGMDDDLVMRLLDPTSRTSDKLGFVSPSRGQQGSASLALLGITSALGGTAPLQIITQQRHYTVQVAVSPGGVVRITPDWCEAPDHDGTTIILTVPRDSTILTLDVGRDFAVLNPHAEVKIRWTVHTSNQKLRAHSPTRFFTLRW